METTTSTVQKGRVGRYIRARRWVSCLFGKPLSVCLTDCMLSQKYHHHNRYSSQVHYLPNPRRSNLRVRIQIYPNGYCSTSGYHRGLSTSHLCGYPILQSQTWLPHVCTVLEDNSLVVPSRPRSLPDGRARNAAGHSYAACHGKGFGLSSRPYPSHL